MLAGDEGPGVKRAMEIICALAHAAGAEELVEVQSAQIAGVSYKNIGEAGLEFLTVWASEGAKARVPAWMNPCGADLEAWEALGFRREFIEKQNLVVEALQGLGVEPTLTCTPYHGGKPPARGAHLAWSESSAVCMANSVFGARTNREGGPSALAAALCGRTAYTGYHLDSARRATHLVEVQCEISGPSDCGALGALVGAQVRDGVPYFANLELPGEPDVMSCMKQLAAGLAASGAVALFHVPGITPEASAPDVLPPGLPAIRVTDLGPSRRGLCRPGEGIDLVALGCPHLSLCEVARVGRRLAGRKVRVPLWLCMSRAVAAEAEREGLLAPLLAAGASIVRDTCLVVAPLSDLGFDNVATNSAKSAIYAAMHGEGGVFFGTLGDCVEAAVEGRWPEALHSETRSMGVPPMAGPRSMGAPPMTDPRSMGVPPMSPCQKREMASPTATATGETPVLRETATGETPVLRTDVARPSSRTASKAKSSEKASRVSEKRFLGRCIVPGEAEGELLLSDEPISFYGGVDPETGVVRDPAHPLHGVSVAGKVLAFPGGKGSTVGSYVLYALKRNGVAPAALLVEKAAPIVTAGAVIAGIPTFGDVDLSHLRAYVAAGTEESMAHTGAGYKTARKPEPMASAGAGCKPAPAPEHGQGPRTDPIRVRIRDGEVEIA